MVFHKSLSDSKFLQVSMILHCILADLNNAAVFIVSIHLLNYKSSCPFSTTKETVAVVPVIIAIPFVCFSEEF